MAIAPSWLRTMNQWCKLSIPLYQKGPHEENFPKGYRGEAFKGVNGRTTDGRRRMASDHNSSSWALLKWANNTSTPVMLNKLRRPHLNVSQSDYLIQVFDKNSNTEWQTVQIQMRQPDLHCSGRAYPGSVGPGLNNNQTTNKEHFHLWNVFVRFIFPQFCKSDKSRYGYLEIFQRVLWTSR